MNIDRHPILPMPPIPLSMYGANPTAQLCFRLLDPV